MRKHARRLLSVSGVVLLMLIVLVPAGLFAFGVLPYEVLVVKTGSMKPTIPVASAVIVEKNEPRFGEPITFNIHSEVVTHRWVGTNENGTLQTKGDANEEADLWELPKSEVIGGVIAIIPQLGFWILFIKNPFTWGALIMVVAFYWLLMQSVKEDEDQLVPA